MRTALEIKLFGGVELSREGTPITGFATQKALALFVYLTLTRQPHTRDHLATLLWGTLDDAASRRALRYVLWNLRQILGPYLKITRHSIAFDHTSPYSSDVDIFNTRTAQIDVETPTQQSVANWRTAVEHYRGEFLQGFHLRQAEEFDAWMLLTRERFQRLAMKALNKLIAYETAKAHYGAGIEYAQWLLELEPWNEQGHRALIELYALNGDYAAAWAQYERCRRVLKEELNAEADAVTVELVERLRARPHAASGAVTDTPKHNLPRVLNPFFGREQEIQRIVAKLNEPTCRLVTLTGEGGIGKTRLALEVATTLIDKFEDGVWFVGLAGVQSANHAVAPVLSRAAADVLGLATDSQSDVTEQLLAYLQPRKLLLILDNLEQFLDSSFELAENDPEVEQTTSLSSGARAWFDKILQRAPGASLVVTSRARLNLAAEYVVRLEGLEVPSEDSDKAQAFPGVQLFLERAERIGIPAAALDVNEIVRLCNFIEGMPLAIELAAAWMNRASPDEMLRTLSNAPDRLATTQSDVPARHRSLHRVFEHSWALLSPTEQMGLAQASIFQNQFTRMAAEQVIVLTDGLREDESAATPLPQVLDMLIEKSLLRWGARDKKFRMHPLIRQFSGEKLSAQQVLAVASRHASLFLSSTAARTLRLLGQDTRAALEEIKSELNDLRAAWEWAVRHRQVDSLYAALQALTTFFEYAGLASEGLADLNRTAQELRTDVTVPQLFLLELDLARATLMLRVRQYAQAQNLAEQVMQQAQLVMQETGQRDLPAFAAWGHYLRAMGLARLPDTEAELFELERARAQAKAENNSRLEALCLFRMGVVVSRSGENQNAHTYFVQALEIFEEIQDVRSVGSCLSMLATAQYNLGEFANSIKSFTRSIEIADLIGDAYSKGVTYSNLGYVYATKGTFDKAIACAEQSEQNYRDSGLPLTLAAQSYRALFLSLQGDWVQARDLLENITAVQDPGHTRRESVWAFWSLALLARRHGRLEDAVRFGRKALELAGRWKDINDQAEVCIALGDALFEQGVLSEAKEHYTIALQLREQMHQEHMYPEAMAGLAHVALRRGESETARMWLDKIWGGESLRLTSGPLEPFWVYWSSYQVMRALEDSRATLLLGTARMVLAEYASQIAAPHIRDQFLQVPWHRAILAQTPGSTAFPMFVVAAAT